MRHPLLTMDTKLLVWHDIGLYMLIKGSKKAQAGPSLCDWRIGLELSLLFLILGWSFVEDSLLSKSVDASLVFFILIIILGKCSWIAAVMLKRKLRVKRIETVRMKKIMHFSLEISQIETNRLRVIVIVMTFEYWQVNRWSNPVSDNKSNFLA